VEAKIGRICRVKYRQILASEIIADRLRASGLSWACSSQVDATGRMLYTANAYSNDGKRFTVISDDKLTAFLELERVTRESLRFC
jgi:hypothetical protein